MKPGARIAIGVGAGYLLGRTKKMRLALMIAAAGATGRSGTSPTKLLQHGLKQLGSTPELAKLTDVARDELLGAVKAAAVTAAGSRIESLTERLQEGGRKQRKDPDDGPDRDAAEGDGETPRTRRRRAPEPEELEEEEPPDDEEEEPERPSRRRASGKDENGDEPDEPERPARRRATSKRAAASSDGDEPSSRRSRTGTGRSPVRRARR
ncbi:hypothetical protein [Amycolatopsis eburnea]|uniref:DNA primase n=1 Tax=Amycolatopsis eburnea TaxID=2267691 RepID=A0A3R9F1R7_9PSEU|nr:hypothetical protein [Amycolatopsis eburnea]RSD11680.1 hypothetical protein EIY87_33465 [Amycolatopsis eburnea]